MILNYYYEGDGGPAIPLIPTSTYMSVSPLGLLLHKYSLHVAHKHDIILGNVEGATVIHKWIRKHSSWKKRHVLEIVV